jgi:hypothetical protein
MFGIGIPELLIILVIILTSSAPASFRNRQCPGKGDPELQEGNPEPDEIDVTPQNKKVEPKKFPLPLKTERRLPDIRRRVHRMKVRPPSRVPLASPVKHLHARGDNLRHVPFLTFLVFPGARLDPTFHVHQLALVQVVSADFRQRPKVTMRCHSVRWTFSPLLSFHCSSVAEPERRDHGAIRGIANPGSAPSRPMSITLLSSRSPRHEMGFYTQGTTRRQQNFQEKTNCCIFAGAWMQSG